MYKCISPQREGPSDMLVMSHAALWWVNFSIWAANEDVQTETDGHDTRLMLYWHPFNGPLSGTTPDR